MYGQKETYSEANRRYAADAGRSGSSPQSEGQTKGEGPKGEIKARLESLDEADKEALKEKIKAQSREAVRLHLLTSSRPLSEEVRARAGL